MNLEQRVLLLAQSIGGDVKILLANQGNLAALTTAAQGSLVAAINELQSEINAASNINDAAASNSTTAVYSANKITTLLAGLKAEVLGGASAAYDTLLEIQNELLGDDTAINNLLTAVSKRVAFDAVQTLTAGEKLQACSNIGVGNYDRDLVADYVLAKT